jgi:hypothetical protein
MFKIKFFEMLVVFFGGLEGSHVCSVQFLQQNLYFFNWKINKFLLIKIMYLNPNSPKSPNPDPDSVWIRNTSSCVPESDQVVRYVGVDCSSINNGAHFIELQNEYIISNITPVCLIIKNTVHVKNV